MLDKINGNKSTILIIDPDRTKTNIKNDRHDSK